ncbi:MAG: ribosome assembly cofactor RimP [Flavobacteriaceae bacterium]|jgi:ribosome maturation factor RimP|nr:ribosome assembly cofactor RimP [Flavobacteriaceae bacterium]
MTLEGKVNLLIEEFLQTRTDLFLISCEISSSNKIEVTIDGDEGISIQDCLDCSRAIENNLDREEEDFELSVYSAGVFNPLQQPRQYKKNIGRDLTVTTTEGTERKGTLTEADEEGIALTWKERRPKEKGKGKETVELKEQIPYENIKKAIISIKF